MSEKPIALGFLIVLLTLSFMGLARAQCNVPSLQQKFNYYSTVAASLLNPADKSVVLSAVSPYPEGSAPPIVTPDASGQPEIQIPSKAAAFYVAGVDAVSQDNKLVAGWAFLEAARRNPTEPIFLNNAAFILLQYDLFDDAREVLNCAVSLAPAFTSAHVNLGSALGNLGDHLGAANSYHIAVLTSPGNADYLYLASIEFARAGIMDMALALAESGLWLESQHDFNALISSLLSESESLTCELPLDPSDAYQNFFNQVSTTIKYEKYLDPLYDYEAQVLGPSLDKAYLEAGPCARSQRQAHTECRDSCDSLSADFWLCLGICDCKYEPLEPKCYLTMGLGEYRAYALHAAHWKSLMVGWFGIEHSMLKAIQGKISSAELQSLQCWTNYFDFSDIEAYSYTTKANLDYAVQNIAISRSNMNGLINFYCNRTIEVVLYTGGAAFGVEPQWCLGPVCFSYDAAGQTVGVSVAILLAGKLTKNVLTGEWGGSLGLGGQWGFGEFMLGGGVYFKSVGGKYGIEPKVTFGPFEVNYLMAFESLNVPLSQYAPDQI